MSDERPTDDGLTDPGALGDGAAGPDLPTVLAAASRRRAPGTATGPWAAPPIDGLTAFERRAGALAAVVDTLTAADLDRPAPRAGGGWRVRDVLAHLTAVERYTGSLLGGAPFTMPPGMDFDHHGMTVPTVDRLRSLGPEETQHAWRVASADARRLLRDAMGTEPDRGVTFSGLRLSLIALLTLRAFEVWTHEEDVLDALGRPLRRPDGSCLHRMSDLAVELIPLGMALRGVPPVDRVLRLVLTGPGGGTWRRALGPAGPHDRDPAGRAGLLIVADGAEFCRLAARRLDPARLDHHREGDPALLDAVLRGAAAFAA